MLVTGENQGRTHKWRSSMDLFILTNQYWLTRKTYIHQFCVDTVCCLNDLTRTMADWDRWRERIKGTCAIGTLSGLYIYKVSKVKDHSRWWLEGSLFDSYYSYIYIYIWTEKENSVFKPAVLHLIDWSCVSTSS